MTCYAHKNYIEIYGCELLTSGMTGLQIRFDFSPEWDGLAKTAVFHGSGKQRDVLLTGDVCTVPWETLTDAGKSLTVGIYGTNGENVVIPTIYATIGIIKSGADPSGDPALPPSPSVVDQILAAGQDALALIASMQGGEPGQIWTRFEDGTYGWADAQTGSMDHRELEYRDADDQHPMSAITGLVAALAGKQPAGSYATEAEVQSKYTKPADGIPADDLAETVQESLDKAESALQSVPSSYRTAAAQDVIDGSKQDKAISDVGGYYTTDTVEGALQEIGAEISGINTLLGSGVIA